jgi:4a-hydroxytetrahydrobiopterin dehydratase
MWQETNNQLHKQFVFSSFSKAMIFIIQMGELAEKMQHHPTFLCSYTKVDVWLQTHNEGNVVTSLDREIAKSLDVLV